MELGIKDLFEDYDIRINKKYTSLLISKQEGDKAFKDHKEALPTKRIKTLPTNEYLEKYSSLTSKPSEILPPGCRYVEPLSNGHTIYVIEEQPQFRTIAMSLSFDIMYAEIKSRGLLEEYDIVDWFDKSVTGPGGGRYFKLNLAFPYVIFVICVNDKKGVNLGYSFLRTSQMLGLSDYLLKMPMTNISENQVICFGDRLNKQSYNTDSEAVKSTIDIFWTSVFNTDYTYNIKAYEKVPGISNFLEWQYLSRKDPMFIYVADWIRYYKNIFDLIKNIKDRYNPKKNIDRYEYRSIPYRNFISTFTKPAIIGEIETGKIRKRIEPIYYDIANGYYIDDIVKLEIGDSFKNISKEKEYFIISFIGQRGKPPIKIRVSYNEKIFDFKFTLRSLQYIKERVEEERFIKTIEINGIEIKANDIVKYIDNAQAVVYKKVFYIRKSIDGRPEIKLGNRYYIAQNLPSGFEKLDIKELNLYDMELKKGEEYLYSHSLRSNYTIIKQMERCTFKGLDVSSSGSELMCVFESKIPERGRNNLSVPLNQPKYRTRNYRKIFPKLERIELCENPFIVSAGRTIRRISTVNDDGIAIPSKVYKTPTNYIVDIDTYNENCNREDIPSLIKDNRIFEIDTHMGSVKFEVGDLVVVANWKNPLNVLDIKRIEGFKLEDKIRTTNLSFVLADKAGNLSEVLFVSHNIVRIGHVRKITTKFEQLSSGTKIIANKARISNFPKKDSNIVIGIIVDGPNPLVLCSNGCTLWYQDVIENFKQIPITSKKWKTLEHANLDPKKIKFQAGDIAIPSYSGGTIETGFLMIQTENSRALRYHPLDTYHRSYDNYSLSRNGRFYEDCLYDCIPNPRISKSKQDEYGYVRATPNFHGGFVLNENSHFLYVNDPRSFINV